jgi:hypothetical protein
MSPKQTQLYWRAWGQVRKAKPDADRHELHRQALGSGKSSKDFTNADFDKVLQVFWSIAKSDSIDPQIRQQNGERRRLIWRIEQSLQSLSVYGVKPLPYFEAILSSKYGQEATVETLSDDDLKKLQITLWARVQTHRKKAGDNGPSLLEKTRLQPPVKLGQTLAVESHEEEMADCPF